MKVLSVKWPWCMFIMFEGKDVENRTRRLISLKNAPLDGLEIGIHCSLKRDEGAGWNLPRGFDKTKLDELIKLNENNSLFEFCKGKVLGTTKIMSVEENNASPWANNGVFHHVLSDPKPFDNPIRTKGNLGLWNWDQ